MLAGLEDGELATGEGGGGGSSTTTMSSSTDTAGGSFPAGSYIAEVFRDEPSHYWRLGELAPPLVFDIGDEPSEGTYFGALRLGTPGAIVGDPDTAPWFDGTDGHVSVDGVPPFGGDDEFSIELWAMPKSIGGTLVAKADYDASTGYTGYMLVQHPDLGGGLQFVRAGGTAGSDSVASEPLKPDFFSHVVATFDGVTMLLYVNGELVDSQVASHDVTPVVGPFTMAMLPSWGVYEGALDEVALYDYALPPDRVAAHYQAGVTP